MMYARISLILTLGFFLPASIRTQQPGGSLAGQVVTDHFGPVREAKVVATPRTPSSEVGVGRFEIFTKDEGRFSLENLPAGSYQVTVTYQGSETASERIVNIVHGKTTEVNFDVGHGCDLISDGTGLVTNQGKGEVVKLAFLQAIDSKFGLLEQRQWEKGLVVSIKNIKAEWLRGIPDLRMRLLNQKQIQQRANLKGDFLYLSFPEIKVRGGCVAVTVTNSWAIGKRSRMVAMSGGGFTYEYRRESGKWSGKFVLGWIS